MTEQKKHLPFVSSETNMLEFTVRALIIGLVLSVVIGAANAYVGLKAGLTIAASYPAAVIGMTLLKAMKGTILEENFTRTVGSSGTSLASGSIFTLPAFYIAGIWVKFDTMSHYITASLLLLAGGLLGIMFMTLLRRVMVENAELQFPEALAAAEIHKAGRGVGTGAKYLFGAMGVGALIQALGQFSFFASSWQKFVTFAKSTISLRTAGSVSAQGGLVMGSPAVSPAFIGVGYIIGPQLSFLIFGGGVLAWGLFVPIVLYFSSPDLLNQWAAANPGQIPAASDWIAWSTAIWKFVVRPIAIGVMLVGASFTLFRMRKNLAAGITRAFGDIRKSATAEQPIDRTARDLSAKWALLGIGISALLTLGIYYYFTHNIFATLVATAVVIVIGFFFAAIGGYLCGVVGSSTSPISGLALSSLIIIALLMVALGMTGTEGVAAVLGVTTVICISSAIAGDVMQDLKAGHILGCTPWRVQTGEIIGMVVAAAIMFIPLVVLNQGDINAGKMALHPYEGGFGSVKLSAPQAGLMAFLAQGIISGQMTWPLIILGMFMGVGLILMQIRSPMLFAIGMYLSLETTFAIFIGGALKGCVDMLCRKNKFNDAQTGKVESIGILLASGLIAGEALMGLVLMGFAFFNVPFFSFFDNPSFLVSLLMFAIIGFILIKIPVKNAGPADQPAVPHISA